jgi:hypothetical protein
MLATTWMTSSGWLLSGLMVNSSLHHVHRCCLTTLLLVARLTGCMQDTACCWLQQHWYAAAVFMSASRVSWGGGHARTRHRYRYRHQAQVQAPGTRHQAPGTRHQAPGTRHQAPGTGTQDASQGRCQAAVPLCRAAHAADELLSRKAHRELLQDYSTRRAAAGVCLAVPVEHLLLLQQVCAHYYALAWLMTHILTHSLSLFLCLFGVITQRSFLLLCGQGWMCRGDPWPM